MASFDIGGIFKRSMVHGRKHEWTNGWKDGRTESHMQLLRTKKQTNKHHKTGLPANRIINKRIKKQTNKQTRHTLSHNRQTNKHVFQKNYPKRKVN